MSSQCQLTRTGFDGIYCEGIYYGVCQPCHSVPALDSCGVVRATGTEQLSLDLLMMHSLNIHIGLICNHQFSLLIQNLQKWMTVK